MLPGVIRWWPWLVLVAAALLATSTLWVQLTNWGVQDWDQHLFYQAVPRLTLLDHHQFPLWNPYHRGGLPLLANPQSRFLYPSFIFVLLFGVPVGVKLEILAHSLCILFGTYRLASGLGLTRAPAVMAAFVYGLGGLFVSPLGGGMSTFLVVALIPWVVDSYLRSFVDRRLILVTVLGFALMFLGGGAHLVPIVGLWLLVFASLEARARGRDSLAVAKRLIFTAVTAACLAGVKLIPSVALMMRYPRLRADLSGYSLLGLTQALLLPAGEGEGWLSPEGFLAGASWGPDERNLYIGVLGVLLLVIGLARYARRRWVLAVCLLVFLWLAMGDRPPLSLWQGLRQLPVFSAMRVAERFRFVFMISLAIFVGLGLQAVEVWFARWTRRPRLAGAVVATVLTLVGVDLATAQAQSLWRAFSIPPLTLGSPESFAQIGTFPDYDRHGWTDLPRGPEIAWGGLYPALLLNLGTISAYEPIAEGEPPVAIPREDPAYAGEVSLVGADGEVAFADWSPNRLRLRVRAEGPATVVVNQRYDDGWRAADRQLFSHRGRLAVPVATGAHRIELTYRPTSFFVGLGFTGVGLVLGLLLLVRRPRPAPRAQGAPGKVGRDVQSDVSPS